MSHTRTYTVGRYSVTVIANGDWSGDAVLNWSGTGTGTTYQTGSVSLPAEILRAVLRQEALEYVRGEVLERLERLEEMP